MDLKQESKEATKKASVPTKDTSSMKVNVPGSKMGIGNIIVSKGGVVCEGTTK
jgi:hypothetical protein